MTRSKEAIAELWRTRKAAQGPWLTAMQSVKEAYNADTVYALPELDKNEKAAVANTVAMGVDQLGMRIASTLPGVFYPPTRPGIKESERRAVVRKRATLGAWEANRMNLKLRTRARHLLAYSCSPVVLRPDMKRQTSRWEVRDPLFTFPSPVLDRDDIAPLDCIFQITRTYAWLSAYYPEAASRLFVGRGVKAKPDDRFDVLEYVDDKCTILICLGKAKTDYELRDASCPGESIVALEHIANKAGITPVAIPTRITLDRPRGQFDDIPPMMQWQARLMALELHATERAVFPDSYLVSRQGETAQFISGPHDGRTGMVNIVKGGEMREVTNSVGFQTNPMLDRLGREARVTGGVPPEFGGESQGNVRTGKRGDAVISAVVDFPVQEAQELLAESLQHENRIFIAQSKAYFGSTKRSFYVKSKGSAGNVDFEPRVDFETDHNIVTYAQAGADSNALVIGGGQRVGIGTMSKRSFMELDPMVSDPEIEHDMVVKESIEAAILSGLQTQVADGSIPVSDAARIMQLVGTDKMELAEAIMKAQKEAQERQAAEAEAAAGDPAAPVDPLSAAAQPGLSLPGNGAEAGTTPPIAPPGDGSTNLSALLSSLRSPQRTLPVEQMA